MQKDLIFKIKNKYFQQIKNHKKHFEFRHFKASDLQKYNQIILKNEQTNEKLIFNKNNFYYIGQIDDGYVNLVLNINTFIDYLLNEKLFDEFTLKYCKQEQTFIYKLGKFDYLK